MLNSNQHEELELSKTHILTLKVIFKKGTDKQFRAFNIMKNTTKTDSRLHFAGSTHKLEKKILNSM